MKINTWDIEANNFYQGVTKVWMVVVKEYLKDRMKSVTHGNLNQDFLKGFFSDPDTIWVGHNILDYDIPVLEKIYGLRFDILVIDTFVLSSLLYPDRRGGHSLASLSGGGKGSHEDFTRYSEEMLTYCKLDVRENEKVLTKLLGELANRERLAGTDLQAIAERCSFRYQTGKAPLNYIRDEAGEPVQLSTSLSG